MIEAPIERLNYFNGQRLEAIDFRLEQWFHINVQQWLNKSLFSSGIGAGLEVEKVLPEPSHAVRVLPGLALDVKGRPIILVQAREVPVAGKPSKPTDPVTGNYLVIEYHEQPLARIDDGCAVQLGGICRAKEDLAWGAPTRIRTDPRLSWQHRWPKDDECKVVIAQVELNDDCSVRFVRTFVRKYVGSSQQAKTSAYALEGEKDIDKGNPKDLYFRVEEGIPNKAELYLRGLRFSTLYYSELGEHQHEINFFSAPAGALPAHKHGVELGELVTTGDGAHRHEITACLRNPEEGVGIEMDPDGVENQLLTGPGGVFGGAAHMEVKESGFHSHRLAVGRLETVEGGAANAHNHLVQGITAKTGALSGPARSGNAYSFLDDLRLAFDGKDITANVLAQLSDRDKPNNWSKLGDGNGSPSDRLSAADSGGRVEGTGEIDLLRIGLDLSPGEHRLTFSVPSGGGKIQYNLYIE